MLTPEFLKNGSVVDIVAPGSGTSPDILRFSIEFLKSQNFRPQVKKNLLKPQLFFSNDDGYRLSSLIEALHSESDAIWCLRGGYGANRLVPDLLKLKRPSRAKWLIGYSDVTSLHVLTSQAWGWKSIHGPLLESMRPGRLPQKNKREVLELLRGERRTFEFKLRPLNPQAFRVKTISGVLSGGNMMTLQSTLGTPLSWSGDQKIVFLEEIGERGYRLDRFFTHYVQSGALNEARAVILGDFVGGEEPDGKSFVNSALRNFYLHTSIPVFKTSQFGHGKVNRPLVVGSRAQILALGDSRVLRFDV